METQANINYTRIEEAIKFLEKNFQHQPSLEEVAEEVHLSAFHFQRLFTEWAGISPKRFLQFLTVDFLKRKLKETRSMEEAAETAGLSGQSRVHDLFTTLEAVTPKEYKTQGSGMKIAYGFHDTPFGQCLIGTTKRGICWLSFISSTTHPNQALEDMRTHWHQSTLHQDQPSTGEIIGKIFQPYSLAKNDKLHLYVKGTNFQIKVWHALLEIPCGGVFTYQDVAQKLGSPKAMQAVGSAVGANHIAYLIPCHRVIRKDGLLGEYRWNAARKKSIIGWEMARLEVA